jgi:uncharacterized protein (TIGR02444 family)
MAQAENARRQSSMNTDEHISANDSGEQNSSLLWEFSLAFYSRRDVPALLLALQDDIGADVNLILFGLWRAKQGRSLSPTEFAALDSVIAEWRRGVVEPIRAVRRTIKTFEDGSPATSSLYTSVKRLELDSERIAQARLEAAKDVAAGSIDHAPERAAVLNLEAYGCLLGRPLSADIVRQLASALKTMADQESRT